MCGRRNFASSLEICLNLYVFHCVINDDRCVGKTSCARKAEKVCGNATDLRAFPTQLVTFTTKTFSRVAFIRFCLLTITILMATILWGEASTLTRPGYLNSFLLQSFCCRLAVVFWDHCLADDPIRSSWRSCGLFICNKPSFCNFAVMNQHANSSLLGLIEIILSFYCCFFSTFESTCWAVKGNLMKMLHMSESKVRSIGEKTPNILDSKKCIY